MLGATLTACSLAPTYERPQPPVSLQWSAGTGDQAATDATQCCRPPPRCDGRASSPTTPCVRW